MTNNYELVYQDGQVDTVLWKTLPLLAFQKTCWNV